MKIKIKKDINSELEKNEIVVNLQMKEENENIKNFIEYIQNYKSQKVIVNKENELIQIELKDIICFFSDKKYNYCKTVKEEFRIKSKLYELEKLNTNFLRISKSCIVNIEQVKCFDIGQTGRIIVKFYDGTEQFVSKRKIRDVINYLEERSV